MDIIHLLPDHVANQIAAGEVIQRPASVIKELMENSVDAGADEIDVWIVDAGKTSIQVIDNGKGMTETDARMAFERHATSKIHEASDLFELHTMGFRGEALASIVAVAQVELKTRTIDDEVGVCLTFKGPKVAEQSPVACPRGAQFTVNNLFFNVPARRRFLKSDATEEKNIMQEFERVALVHPDISFSFHKDNNLVCDLRQSTFKKRIINLFGSSFDKSLLPVHVETDLVKIDGFIGTPESAKPRGARQFFFVNDRYMKHPYFHRAIQTAYERVLPNDKQVSYFLVLEVEPSRIDVNIHPTKTEIKFADEQTIWQILLAAVKETLGSLNAIPSIDFDQETAPEIPVFNPNPHSKQPSIKVDKYYNPFSTPQQRANTKNWKELFNVDRDENIAPSFLQQGAKDISSSHLNQLDFSNPEQGDSLENESTSGFISFDKYILTQASSGIMIIHKTRAHIRVLYDKYLMQLSQKDGIPQGLLFPEILQVPMAQNAQFLQLLDDFQALGFDLSPLGGASYAINGIPSGMEQTNPTELLLMLLDNFSTKGISTESIHSSMALALAKHNAINAKQNLSEDEVNTLVSQLFQTSSPKYSPDGKNIITILDVDKLDSLLK